MHRTIHLLLILVLALSGCTSVVPRDNLPYPLTNEEFAPHVKVVTIPLPVIAASPNEGVAYGALTAFLLHNKRDEVSTLIAPQVNQNDNFGTTFSLYGAFYPSADQSWEANFSRSAKVNKDYEIKYRGTSFLERKLELNAFVYDFSDGSSRFFGFESESRSQDETNYADKEYGFTLSAGYQILKNVQFVVGERLRRVEIGAGAVSGVPFIRDTFSEAGVPGIGGFTTHAQKIALVYSSLDSVTLPTSGGYARASVESSFKQLGNRSEYRHYEGELKGYLPLDEARYISVARVVYNQTLGGNVPFLERSILGGENSLRAYGRNRFIDNSYILVNLEERIRLFRWRVFNVTADWELAPFIDLGAVMVSLDKTLSRDFKVNPGIGLRAVVRPNILGRIDVGFGPEGPAVFVGLGYPF